MKAVLVGRVDRRADADVVWLAIAGPSDGPAEEIIGPADQSAVDGQRSRRFGRLVTIAAVAVLVAVAAVRATVDGRTSRRVTVAAPPPAVVADLNATQRTPLPPPVGQLLDLVATPSGLYVLTANPPRLALRGPLPAPHPVATPRSGFAVVDDPARHLVWVLGRRLDAGSATAYDSRTLAWRGRVMVPSPVNAATTLGGRLWLATDAGVYVVRGPGGPPALLLPGSYRYTYAIAADPTHGRVVAVTTGSPGQTYGIDVTNLYVGRDDLVPTGRSSVAVVEGMVWVGGFGAGRHIWLLDGPDRQPPLAVEGRIGLGVVVWAGRHVVWVSYSGGGVSCLDPRTGTELASLPDVTGPITSADGVLYAAKPTGVVTQPLPRRCPG